MSKAKFQYASKLIKEKKYSEARKILQEIDHPKAKEWLAKLPQETKSPNHVAILAISAGVLIVGFILGLLIGRLSVPDQTLPSGERIALEQTATSIQGTYEAFQNPPPTGTPASAVAATVTSAPEANSGAIAGKWLFDSDVSALDDTSSYFLLLEAEDSIRAWLSNPTPSLIIRCRNRQYDVYISVDTQLESTLDDEVFTKVRYGDNPPINVTMGESTTGEAMFFPDAEAAIRNLLPVNRLVVGFTPFNANSVEAIFDITGIETAIQPLFNECGRP